MLQHSFTWIVAPQRVGPFTSRVRLLWPALHEPHADHAEIYATRNNRTKYVLDFPDAVMGSRTTQHSSVSCFRPQEAGPKTFRKRLRIPSAHGDQALHCPICKQKKVSITTNEVREVQRLPTSQHGRDSEASPQVGLGVTERLRFCKPCEHLPQSDHSPNWQGYHKAKRLSTGPQCIPQFQHAF